MLKSYKRSYSTQRYHAISKRDIDWNFTFDTWLEWWGEDIINRGHLKGQLVMARIGDIGPYSPDNVRKLTVEENVIEAQKGKAKSAEHVAKCVLGRALAHQNKQLMKETA